MRKIVPRCRFCDEPVECFGDVHPSCDGDDSLLRLTRDDAARLVPDREDP